MTTLLSEIDLPLGAHWRFAERGITTLWQASRSDLKDIFGGNEFKIRRALDAYRLWSRVRPGAEDECWPYMGARNELGYGVIRPSGQKRNVKAHRLAYEIANDTYLLVEAKVLHSCDNPPCCNPAHLSAGTQAQNVADMLERGRREYVSRLSPEMLDGMLRMRAAGATQRDIAEEYGVARSYVSMLLAGRRGVYIRKEQHGE